MTPVRAGQCETFSVYGNKRAGARLPCNGCEYGCALYHAAPVPNAARLQSVLRLTLTCRVPWHAAHRVGLNRQPLYASDGYFFNSTFLGHNLSVLLVQAVSGVHKGKFKAAQQFACFIICLCTGHDYNVHAPHFIHLVILNLWENDLLFDAHCIIALTIKTLAI
jgi:hypothetical protein